MQGGEIFVPKIPSMKIVDLARCLAPDLPHRMIGIRPGEKLHEVMITTEDARHTMELDDRYVILPEFGPLPEFPQDSASIRCVAEGFIYASNTNEQWLDENGLMRLLAESEMGGQ